MLYLASWNCCLLKDSKEVEEHEKELFKVKIMHIYKQNLQLLHICICNIKQAKGKYFKSDSKILVIIDNKQKQWVLISLHTVHLPIIYDIHVHTTIQIMVMIKFKNNTLRRMTHNNVYYVFCYI